MTRSRELWVLFVLCFGVGLVTAALTTLYAAGPSLAADLRTSQTELTWITDAYTLVLAALLLPAGALGDRHGRREVMIVGAFVFGVAAGTTMFVDSVPALIAARGALGVGAALLMPSTLSIITSTFSDGLRETAVSIWTAAFALAGASGMMVAGALLKYFDWHSAFWSVFIGAVLFLAMSFTVPKSQDKDAPPLDLPGSALSIVAMAALVYGLIEAGLRGWTDPVIVGSFALAALAAVAFALVELRVAHPMLDVRLFRDRVFGVSAFAIVVIYVGIFGLFFLLILFQQFVLGFSALTATVPIACSALPMIPVTAASSRLQRVFGFRAVITGGLLLLAATFACLLNVNADSSMFEVIVPCIVIGFAAGLSMVPSTEAIITSVPAAQQGVAAAINHSTRELGTALGVALVGGLVSASYTSHVAATAVGLPGPARDASRESVAGALAVAEQAGPQGAGLAEAAREAFVAATHHTATVMIVLCVLASVVAACWTPGRRERRGFALSAQTVRGSQVGEDGQHATVGLVALRDV
ncbi:MFS transporter [Nocardioides humilatus]|uniref:MFS transporter n=1 Tax=Nocardioides humilatus TaxID=2607660 RepID=A0A5B1LMW8_9ACTN|nr:MFS transporter [Nocardioides humilatus]KAA1420987.1 MFS transporter [Nocardioides humilatus]